MREGSAKRPSGYRDELGGGWEDEESGTIQEDDEEIHKVAGGNLCLLRTNKSISRNV